MDFVIFLLLFEDFDFFCFIAVYKVWEGSGIHLLKGSSDLYSELLFGTDSQISRVRS